VRHAACDMQRAACDMQHAACDMRHGICSVQRAARGRIAAVLLPHALLVGVLATDRQL
jgi:hypothetical protein